MTKRFKILAAIVGILGIAAIAWAGTISQQPYGISTPKWYGYSSGVPASYYLAAPTLSANDTACGIGATQTLTNKTLTSPTITGGTLASITSIGATTITGTTINGTNYDAGASGTAGTVDIFPTTASKGKLTIQATNNSDDFGIILTNAANSTSVKTITFPALTGYVGLSTAALSLAEMDVLDAAVVGTVVASKAVVADSNKDVGDFRNLDAVNVDAGVSGTAGTVDIFPSTAASGKVAITAADSAGDFTTTIVNASQAAARTYTIPDAGAAANFCLLTSAQSVAGQIGRTDLTEDVLQVYGIPVNQIMAADGAALAVSETAGDFFLSLGTNTIDLRGEESISETESSVGYIQFVLPPEYVAAGDVKIRFRCKIDGAGTDNSSTFDVEAYEQADGAVGADICATAAESFAAKSTYYNKDFTITATGLVAGDILNIKFTAAVIESAGSALAFYSDPPKMLLDVKG